MRFGEVIEAIRKNKNINIKDLIDGIMTRTTYYRFVNNDTQLSMTNFVKLMNRLNLHIDDMVDFLTINIDLEKKSENLIFDLEGKSYLKELSTPFLWEIRNQYEQWAVEDAFYRQFIWEIDFQLFNEREIDNLDLTIQEIKDYLWKVSRWYIYEFKLVQQILLELDFATTTQTLKQIELYFKDYPYDAKHDFLFDLLSDIYFIHIIDRKPVDLMFFDQLIGRQTRSYTLVKYQIVLRFFEILLMNEDFDQMHNEMEKLRKHLKVLHLPYLSSEIDYRYQAFLNSL